MKIRKIIRINFGGDWECSLCGDERWSHYAFITDKGKIIYICKDCVEKESGFTDSIRSIEKKAKKVLKEEILEELK